MVRVSATAKAGSSTLNSLRTAAVIVSGFVVVRITIDAVGKVDCQNGREACGRGFSSRLALRMSSTTPTRSEEHTSELQSRLHLVCRLLLEKKKNSQTIDGVAGRLTIISIVSLLDHCPFIYSASTLACRWHWDSPDLWRSAYASLTSAWRSP